MAGSSCRNPDKGKQVWCYTSDDGEEWEYCDVPICDKDCQDLSLDYPGSNFIGKKATTVSGKDCVNWNKISKL